MGEYSKKLGEKCEDRLFYLLSCFGWEKGGTNVDVSGIENKLMGIDAFYSYVDPLLEKRIGILAEAKTRSYKYLDRKLFDDTLKSMVEKISTLPYTDDFNEKLNIHHAGLTNTGFIGFWTHDGFNQEKYHNLLTNTEIPKKRIGQRIFIAGNKDIQKFISILETREKIKSLKDNIDRKCDVCYPCLTNSVPVELDLLSLEMLYSAYIFCTHTETKTVGGSEHVSKHLDILYFDEIKLEALDLMCLAINTYQLLKDIVQVNLYIYEPNGKGERDGTINAFKDNWMKSEKNRNIIINVMPMYSKSEDLMEWGGLVD